MERGLLKESGLFKMKVSERTFAGTENYHYLEKVWEKEEVRLPKTFPDCTTAEIGSFLVASDKSRCTLSQ